MLVAECCNSATTGLACVDEGWLGALVSLCSGEPLYMEIQGDRFLRPPAGWESGLLDTEEA